MQLVLLVPEHGRCGGAEAVRAVSVVMPVLQAAARLEFKLQNTDPNDLSQLPPNHGEELVLQLQSLCCSCLSLGRSQLERKARSFAVVLR